MKRRTECVAVRRYEDPGYREIVEEICRQAGFKPRVLQAVESKHTVLDLVAQGMGISFVQASAAAQRSEGVRYRQFPRVVPYVDSVIAWRDDVRLDTIDRLVAAAEHEAEALKGDRIVAMLREPMRAEAV